LLSNSADSSAWTPSCHEAPPAQDTCAATISAFCRRHHIKRLALFGSALGDDVRPDSDIDVLVEFEPGHVPGLRFVSIERELSGILGGRRVDMVTPKILNARIRDQVLGSAQSLYVAA
jgi:hypothetical protein